VLGLDLGLELGLTQLGMSEESDTGILEMCWGLGQRFITSILALIGKSELSHQH
jgi:hypothetical protein